jgi:hypothetical protein
MVAEREMEGLNLYQPLPFQDKYHAHRAKEVLLSKGNQAGGSITGFAEDARAATGQDPYGKYPTKNGIIVCLGYGERHISNVIHKYLFRWGAFDIIRDDKTGDWRSFRPWDDDEERLGMLGDASRKEESRPAPPFIPERLIKNITYKKKGDRVFSTAFLKNGYEIYAYNSQGEYEHAQGFQCDLWHIDEDVATEGWVSEAMGRLSKREGLFRWTAMPHAKTDDIVTMVERAEEEAMKPNPQTVIIYVSIDENPYLSDKTKVENKRVWLSHGEEEYQRRAMGRLILTGRKMYPRFDVKLHGARKPLTELERQRERNGDKKLRCKVQAVYSDNHFNPPDDWCVYLSIDPGYTIGAAEWIAIPPPQKFGNFMIVYDEHYLQNCTASMMADSILDKWDGRPIQDIVFDMHGGRLRSIGTGEMPHEVYQKELRDRNIETVGHGYNFVPGSDDIRSRELALRELLSPRGKNNQMWYGYPSIFIDTERCPNLVNELKHFKKKVSKVNKREVVLDQGDRRMTHAVECVEQAVGRGLPYIKPKSIKRTYTSAERVLAANRRFRNLQQPSTSAIFVGINLGPQGYTPQD